jgi:hypothetical protein
LAPADGPGQPADPAEPTFSRNLDPSTPSLPADSPREAAEPAQPAFSRSLDPAGPLLPANGRDLPAQAAQSTVGPSLDPAGPSLPADSPRQPAEPADRGLDRSPAAVSLPAAGDRRPDGTGLDRDAGGPEGMPADLASSAGLARQVEAARRHLQAAMLVAHEAASQSRSGGLLGAVEQILMAVTELARESRDVLPRDLYDRTFPGEARFLCAVPWERASLVAADPYEPEPASPTGLARLLDALGYEAHAITTTTGVASVQVRTERYSAHIALVEPTGGGRQRWSGALEWTDQNGVTRTWAETLGPVELEEEELARRVDELLRRCVGPRL